MEEKLLNKLIKDRSLFIAWGELRIWGGGGGGITQFLKNEREDQPLLKGIEGESKKKYKNFMWR